MARAIVYVLDALTGELKQKITTGSGAGLGDAATPSGLAQINNYVDNVDVDNTTLRAYGGDVLGNIWRFDFAAGTATRLGTAKDASNNVAADHDPTRARRARRQAVRHGRHRQATSARSDVTDAQRQSVYGIKDPLTGSSPIYAGSAARLAAADGDQQTRPPPRRGPKHHLHGVGRRLRPHAAGCSTCPRPASASTWR